jgi:hypothetical protein
MFDEIEALRLGPRRDRTSRLFLLAALPAAVEPVGPMIPARGATYPASYARREEQALAAERNTGMVSPLWL